jgi:hypothetical protein
MQTNKSETPGTPAEAGVLFTKSALDAINQARKIIGLSKVELEQFENMNAAQLKALRDETNQKLNEAREAIGLPRISSKTQL